MKPEPSVPQALLVACRALHRGDTVDEAIRHAAEALAADPWAVVTGAGALARADWRVHDEDVGLDARLKVVPVTSSRAVVQVPAGMSVPRFDGPGRRRRGAWDTPAELALGTVQTALQAARGEVRRGLDPTCGAGAFLVAMHQLGVSSLLGTDLDARAVAVARVACPAADVRLADVLDGGDTVDLLVMNPPFVAPEHQDRALRKALRVRFPWLSGRFDLSVPLVACALERLRTGGGAGLLLPSPILVERYAEALRRRWLADDAIVSLTAPASFPGVTAQVCVVGLSRGQGPCTVGASGVHAKEVLGLPRAPLDARLEAGDIDLLRQVRAASVPLGELAVIDTGLVSHGAKGGKARLMSDTPGPDCVPYADARDVFAGRHTWLRYVPEEMHRPKRPELFEAPKLIVQRLVGRGPIRVRADRTGLYVGHTCTVVVPHDDRVTLERLAELVADPLVAGVLAMERGPRLDLYPHDVASIPVPVAWLRGEQDTAAQAWGLSHSGIDRLLTRAQGGVPSTTG